MPLTSFWPLGLLLAEMQLLCLRSWMPQQPPFRTNCRSLLRTFGMVTAYNSTQKISKVEMRLYFSCDVMWLVRLDVCELKFPTQYEDTNLRQNSQLSFKLLHTRRVFPFQKCVDNWAICQLIVPMSSGFTTCNWNLNCWPSFPNPFLTSLLTLLILKLLGLCRLSSCSGLSASLLRLLLWHFFLCYFSRLLFRPLLRTCGIYFSFHDGAVPFVSIGYLFIYSCPLSQLFFIRPQSLPKNTMLIPVTLISLHFRW